MENNIKTPFGELTYLGDLLSTVYPTTVLYHNEQNEPIIVEWLDEDDKLEIDLYIIYKTTVELLDQFIKGIISHLDLIKSTDKSQYYEFSGSIFNAKFKQINFNKIDKGSLPKAISYFNENLSLDYI